jgi:polysaccharide export outer membrane protein
MTYSLGRPCFALCVALSLSPLSAGSTRSTLPRDRDAYAVIPVAVDDGKMDYVLGPADVISLTVVNEPTLSLQNIQITTGGTIAIPLIGEVKATGLTATGLARSIASRLGEHMLINPDVSVNITMAASQKVAVDGSVGKPGIYRLEGRATLLGALAMAEGTTRVSALSQVTVFRTIDGEPMGALFDVGKIRRGELPDPEIRGGDTVVVGFSNLKGLWRDILTTAPVIAAFRAYR